MVFLVLKIIDLPIIIFLTIKLDYYVIWSQHLSLALFENITIQY